MSLIDCTRISHASTRRFIPSRAICQFPERMSQVASTGPKQSKTCMRRRSPGLPRDLILACLLVNNTRRGQRSSMLLKSVSGRFVNPTCRRRHLSRPSVNVSNSFCPNSLSLWLFQEFPRTTTSRSAVFVLWSSHAKSVGAHAVPKVHRRVWDLPASLVPGWLKISILSTSVSLS